MNEAAILAGENVCSYEDIDKACELGYNLPMGPLKLADAIGIDVMIEVMESLYQETADSKYRPAHLYKVLYRAGRLGRKSGKGFYDYTK
ncbi:MAG: 3-hydroxyacyl-CoA dehydrogenase family protein [Evtepia gabavorous]